MAKVRYNQNSFVGGELDPTLFGRTDIDNYYAGAAKLRNVVVLPQGGVRRRDGLRFVADLGAGTTPTRLVPFIFNDEQEYLFVFAVGKLDVYRDDTLVATITTAPISTLTTAILAEMNWTQSNDVLLLVHPDIEPIEIARISDSNWTANNVVFNNVPSFAFSGITLSSPATTCTPDSVSGTINLTTAAAFWNSSHVGQFVNINDGRVLITSITSSTIAKGSVRVELSNTNLAAINDWQLETGYEPVISASRGWARSITFYQGRLVLGGLKSRPQTLLFSKVGSFFDFDVDSASAADAIDVTIDDDRANVIRNIFPGRGLQIFTTGGEFLASAGSISSPITPDNITLQRGTFHGSGNVRPESIDGATLFVEANGRVIRSFLFSDVEQAFATDDVTLLSAHLVGNIKHMALRRSTAADGANFLYVVNGDGTVAVLNTLRSQNLRAWTLFETTGTFTDTAVVGDDVYFIVQRNINGVDVQYLEKLDNSLLLDSGTSDSAGTPQSLWSGFDHLEGENVSVVGDGFTLADTTVSSANITTSEPVSTVQAGLPFTVEVKTLPLLAPFNQQMMGENRRLIAMNMLFEASGQVWVEAGRTLTRPSFKVFGDNILDTPPAAKSGWLKVPLGGVSREPAARIFQTQPAPFHLLSLTIELGV